MIRMTHKRERLEGPGGNEVKGVEKEKQYNEQSGEKNEAEGVGDEDEREKIRQSLLDKRK